MAKNINAPGYLINELDMSQYARNIDNSFDNAPACLILGYGDSGASSIPRWINTMPTFVEYFGYPQTEEEKYFYNAADEILRRNGVCIAAKLPYDNDQSKKYVAVKYNVEYIENAQKIESIHDIDNTIDSILDFQLDSNGQELIDKTALENYLSKTQCPNENQIVIVDVQKTIMDKVNFPCLSTDEVATNDCLGIVPVLFTASNAAFYQGLIDSNISPLSNSFQFRHNESISIDEEAIAENLSMPLSSDNIYDNAVANIVESQYPTLQWKDQNTLLRDNLKYVGVAVLKAYADKANDGQIAFKMVECFVGSLVNQTSQNGLKLIDDVVNNQSMYINIFSNIQQDDYMKADITYAHSLQAPMLGFYRAECKKTIPESSKILDDTNEILNKLDNANIIPVDIVVDAGMSTIAFNKAADSSSAGVGELKSMEQTDSLQLPYMVDAWYKHLCLYNQFCSSKRKDCMFIADIPRSFCLNGQSKIVNPLSSKTIRNNILPMLKKLKRLNTSYGAGYAIWLYQQDAYAGQYMWMPPSIKMSGVYIYCDTYFHPWSAPAGLTRGVLSNVVDVAFNPGKQDCEQLYTNGWNYTISYPMSGIVVEGQKTFQSEATALDRVNVRRLMLSIEQSVAFVARYFVYENNTPYQRQLFTDKVTAILTEVRNGNGISEFAVKCDDTNNTPETIDRNELHLNVAVKPVKSIEFIILQFALTSQTADVQETVARL